MWAWWVAKALFSDMKAVGVKYDGVFAVWCDCPYGVGVGMLATTLLGVFWCGCVLVVVCGLVVWCVVC